MDEQLQKDGANARAFGKSAIDNPFYKSENMPAATGESIEEWGAKEAAWAFGWAAEDMIRGDGFVTIPRMRLGLQESADSGR